MVATDKVFSGSIPELYERLMVPLIFEPYARDLAGRIAKSEAGPGAGDGGWHRRSHQGARIAIARDHAASRRPT